MIYKLKNINIPNPVGNKIANFSTNKNAGIAKIGCGTEVKIAHSTEFNLLTI